MKNEKVISVMIKLVHGVDIGGYMYMWILV